MSVKFIEIIPLLLFVIYIRIMDMSSLESWFIPFMIGGSLSILISLYLVLTKSILNRITLGINLYLISGMVAVLLSQLWLMQLYYDLQATGMLFWVFVTGLISMLSQYGFIGLKNDNRAQLKHSCVFTQYNFLKKRIALE